MSMLGIFCAQSAMALFFFFLAFVDSSDIYFEGFRVLVYFVLWF